MRSSSDWLKRAEMSVWACVVPDCDRRRIVSSIESSPTRGGSRSELRRSLGDGRSSGLCVRHAWTILVCRASLTLSQVGGKTISGRRRS